MTRRIAIGCLAVLVAGFAAPAKAELYVYIQDATVTAGSTATLNVYVGSDGSPTSSDAFSLFQIQLDSNAPAPNQLGFTANGSTAYLNQSPYLLNGNSGDFQNSISPWTLPTPVVVPSPAVQIGDFTVTGTVYPPDNTAGDTLLGQVQISAEATNSGTYTNVITLDTNSANTFFMNDTGSVTFAQGYAPGYGGTITVLPASVPEPASIVSGLTAVLLLAGFNGIQRHRRSRSPSA